MNQPLQLSRRALLRGIGVGAAGALAYAALGACGSDGGNAPAAGGDPWKRYQGTTINFISENTAPTAAIAANTSRSPS